MRPLLLLAAVAALLAAPAAPAAAHCVEVGPMHEVCRHDDGRVCVWFGMPPSLCAGGPR